MRNVSGKYADKLDADLKTQTINIYWNLLNLAI